MSGDDLFMDYWIYHKVWEGRDPFLEEEQEQETVEQEPPRKFYDNNSSKGNSREY